MKTTSDNYIEKLRTQNNIILLVPLGNVKSHHLMKCLVCEHEWEATPLSKIQTYKKFGYSGCPNCKQMRKNERDNITRQQNKQILTDRGLLYPDWWTGQRVLDKDNTPIDLPVTQIKCGHSFISTVHNLLSRDIICTVCGIEERTANINKWSKQNSDEWKKTASDWKIYKSKVTSLTRIAYKQNKHKINPNNLPTGRAGTEGAYHLDHIVPIRYCFENGISEELCAHPDNLQMLHWTDNVGSKDKLKNYVPKIFETIIKGDV